MEPATRIGLPRTTDPTARLRPATSTTATAVPRITPRRADANEPIPVMTWPGLNPRWPHADVWVIYCSQKDSCVFSDHLGRRPCGSHVLERTASDGPLGHPPNSNVRLVSAKG